VKLQFRNYLVSYALIVEDRGHLVVQLTKNLTSKNADVNRKCTADFGVAKEWASTLIQAVTAFLSKKSTSIP
jgi:hypothetical protein